MLDERGVRFGVFTLERRSMKTCPTLRMAALTLALLQSVACGADETAVDLHFLVDPSIADEASLARSLQSLEIVIDAPQGLYPRGTMRDDDPLRIVRDVDKDGWPELLATVELAEGATRLPVVRVERGALDTASIELRVDGVARAGANAGKRIAAGGLKEASYVAGELREVQLPFNLRPAYRPPYVAAVYPADGSRDVLPSTGSMLIVFSKPMALTSLQGANVIQLLAVDGDQETPVRAARIELREQYAGGPTMAEYHFAEPLAVDRLHRVRVTSAARDVAGRALDQQGQKSGNQPFESQFSTSPEAVPSIPSTMTQWCDQGGNACAPGLRCDNALKGCLPDGCPASCGAQQVCDRALGACVTDCRVYGTYGLCSGQTSCQPTGLCE